MNMAAVRLVCSQGIQPMYNSLQVFVYLRMYFQLYNIICLYRCMCQFDLLARSMVVESDIYNYGLLRLALQIVTRDGDLVV